VPHGIRILVCQQDTSRRAARRRQRSLHEEGARKPRLAGAITSDGVRSYGAALDELGCQQKQEVGRWANNRVENSDLAFQRRERAMLRFRQMKTLQKSSPSTLTFATHSLSNVIPSIASSIRPATPQLLRRGGRARARPLLLRESIPYAG
jgi:hypothetical protein